jgi:hypothetical protein
MQSFTRSKKIFVWSGNLSIGKVLVMGSLALLTQFTQVEAAAVHASPCTLAWDQCQDPAISGYALYYGIMSSATTNRLDAGITNMVTLKNLFAGSNYFFYVVGYNSSRMESSPSSMIYYTPKALSALNLTKLADGTASLHFLAATGAVCRVEYTPTLNPPQWQTLNSATAYANGNITLSDTLT